MSGQVTPGTPDPTAQPPAADTQPPATAVLPRTQPPVSPYTREDIYAPDGKKWKDKFHGAQGYAKQKEAELMTVQGGMTAQIESVNQSVLERDSTITALQQQVVTLTEQSNTIPALQEQVTQLTDQAGKVEKYQIAMRYPQLLGMQVEEEVKNEAGDTVKRTVNPVLDLIESSGLEGPALEMTLQRMTSALSAADSATGKLPSPVAPATPSPAAPAGDDKQAWIIKARDAQSRLCGGDMDAWKDFEEAAAKIRELEVLEASTK